MKKEIVKRLKAYSAMQAAAENLPFEDRQEQLEKARASVQWLQRMLCYLTPEERLLLDRLFVHKRKGSVDELCQLLHLEKSSIYRRRQRLLNKLIQYTFGGEI